MKSMNVVSWLTALSLPTRINCDVLGHDVQNTDYGAELEKLPLEFFDFYENEPPGSEASVNSLAAVPLDEGISTEPLDSYQDYEDWSEALEQDLHLKPDLEMEYEEEHERFEGFLLDDQELDEIWESYNARAQDAGRLTLEEEIELVLQRKLMKLQYEGAVADFEEYVDVWEEEEEDEGFESEYVDERASSSVPLKGASTDRHLRHRNNNNKRNRNKRNNNGRNKRNNGRNNNGTNKRNNGRNKRGQNNGRNKRGPNIGRNKRNKRGQNGRVKGPLPHRTPEGTARIYKNICLDPPDPWRTCFTRKVDPKADVDCDFKIQRNVYNYGAQMFNRGKVIEPIPLPYKKPYYADDEVETEGMMHLSLIQAAKDVGCDDLIDIEETVLKFLADNVGDDDTFHPACAFVNAGAVDQRIARGVDGRIVQTTALQVEVSYFTKKRNSRRSSAFFTAEVMNGVTFKSQQLTPATPRIITCVAVRAVSMETLDNSVTLWDVIGISVVVG